MAAKSGEGEFLALPVGFLIEKRTRPASAVLMSRPQGNGEH